MTPSALRRAGCYKCFAPCRLSDSDHAHLLVVCLARCGTERYETFWKRFINRQPSDIPHHLICIAANSVSPDSLLLSEAAKFSSLNTRLNAGTGYHHL